MLMPFSPSGSQLTYSLTNQPFANFRDHCIRRLGMAEDGGLARLT
jgi:hypothetical protein